jgi:hypothetical protein
LDQYYLRCFLPVFGELPREYLHDFRVELRHEDLDRLVRLQVDLSGQIAVQWVQGVEVPTVPVLRRNTTVFTFQSKTTYECLLPVDGTHAVGGAVGKHLV